MELRKINLGDTYKGIVRNQNDSGVYIRMKIGEEEIPVFSYWCGDLEKGSIVTCSVKKVARGNKLALVNIDSVDYDDLMVA